MAKESELTNIIYLFGIISIILAVVSPIAGIILGIVGIIIDNKEKKKDELSKKGRKFCKIAIIVGIIFLILTIILAYSLNTYFGVGV